MNASEEEFIPDDEAEQGEGALKKLRERLKKAVEEKQEYLEGWQRSRADFANFKREEVSIHADKEERLKAELIESLLPALDALELSLKHDDSTTLKMIEKQFLDALKSFGIERFGKIGEAFDPHLHEALAQKGEEHKIVSVERSGYRAGDKIIRPAQVII
jgi:molecular chaperone GrpE